MTQGWVERARASYDEVAEDYDALLRGLLDQEPWERVALDLLVDRVRDAGGGAVLDVGCGTGRVAAYLAGAGLDVSGVDLSPGMVAVARREHPGLRVEVGDMTRLDLADGSLAAALAWYSLIHLPDEAVQGVLASLVRALRPGGLLLVGFHVGQEVRRKTSGYGGHAMDVDVHLRPTDTMLAVLEAAGLHVGWQALHVPEPGATPQGALLGWLSEPAGG